MANESSAASMSALVHSILEGALLVAREQSVMAGLVQTFSDMSGIAARVRTDYAGGTIQTIAETTDMSAQTFTPSAGGTITISQVGAQYFITDLRVESDYNAVVRDASTDLGQIMAVKMDTDLVGNFSSLTGGTVGTAGGTLSWANVFAGVTYLRAAFAPQPYVCVLRPEQWYFLANTLSAGQTVTNAPALQNSIAAQWFVGNAYGVDFYVDANLTAGTACNAGMFSRQAIGFDLRRATRIEAQRDASRGGGGYELNMTAVYGHGVWRPTFGIKMLGTSTLP
jgi:hypothetical protein